jgi:hypothetical protein
MRRSILVAALFLVGLTVAGCGLSDPSAGTATAQRERLPKPEAAGEYTGHLAPALRAGGPLEVVRGTPQAALRYAAGLAGNWTSATAAQAFSRLAAISAGEARAEFEQIAARARTDVQQVLGYSHSRATVEAVNVKGTGRSRQAIVVTKEQIATPELPHLPAEYRVTLVTLRDYGSGWAISSWSPQQ